MEAAMGVKPGSESWPSEAKKAKQKHTILLQSLQNSERLDLCCFKALCSRQLVTEATGTQSTLGTPSGYVRKGAASEIRSDLD